MEICYVIVSLSVLSSLSFSKADFQCTQGSFKCKTEEICIDVTWICDGEEDCTDGSDEDKVTCPSSGNGGSSGSGCTDGLYGDNCNQSCSVIPNCDVCTLYKTPTQNPNVVVKSLSCNKCSANFTGKNCTEKCSSNCKDDVCDILRGTCFKGCKSGFFGDYCNKTCPDGCKANFDGIISCNQSTAECKFGCKAGFFKRHCNKTCDTKCKTDNSSQHLCGVDGQCIYGCIPGQYGTNCRYPCPKNCGGDGSCDQSDGSCEDGCNVGFYGANCNKTCPNGCKANLDGIISCNQSTAECKFGCKAGFFNPHCNKTCDAKCRTDNSSQHLCDVDGQCIYGCTPGQYGTKCLYSCPKNCGGDGSCDQSDGSCEDGCNVGFYGNFCNDSCSVNCAGNGSCFKGTGSCLSECEIGYYGDRCDKTCSINCKPNGTCHHKTGNCSNECINDFYGPQCLNACPANCMGNICLKQSGQCGNGCKKGWFDSMCTTLCDCSGESCNQMTGSCMPDNKMWIIITVSAIGFVALLLLSVFCVCRMRNVKHKKQVNTPVIFHTERKKSENIYVDHQSNERPNSTSIVHEVVSKAGMLINRNTIVDDKEIIGQGNFAEVRKGRLVGAPPNQFVAVKTIQALHTPKDFQDFQQELQIIGSLGHHPNVVDLKGFCVDDATNCIGAVLEFCPNGDLKTYLRKLKAPKDLEGDLQALVYKQFVKFAIDVASGMEHISEKGVIHRDLAARNVLLDGNLVAKVSDFGLSRIQNTYTVSNMNVQLPIKWMALESLIDCVFTTASDVWSFGVVVWEIFSLGATPFSYEKPNDILLKLKNGKRLQKPEECDDDIYELMLDCWNEEPTKRPSFSELRDRLIGHIDKIMGNDYQVISDIDRGDYNKINEAMIVDYEKLIDANRDPYSTSGDVTLAGLRETECLENSNTERNSHRSSYLTPTDVPNKEESNFNKENDNGEGDNLKNQRISSTYLHAV